ncbi:hypothetical protein HLB44_30830 [Aquincola sp. S2]|uniref:Uncharacterized protein n=1 Tax=Pseudaquabacterium terrae TaxID=2732868 RepID=A0ABX2ERS9_9BURK|nr:hypothetical protein [Aquabacterium terrae]NRF71389.1 hypothetical protein [Aquabacterium terrae]
MIRLPYLWLCLAAGVFIALPGMHAVGMPLPWSTAIAALFFLGTALVTRRAYLRPERFDRRAFLLTSLTMMLATYGVAVAGTLAGLWRSTGALLAQAAPALLLGACGMWALLYALLAGRGTQLQRELQRAREQVEAEKASTRRSEHEGRLQLLQAEVTSLTGALTELQPLVDSHDARATPLLHALTRSLRASEAPADGQLPRPGVESSR